MTVLWKPAAGADARRIVAHIAVIELIAATTTKTGLTVACELDDRL